MNKEQEQEWERFVESAIENNDIESITDFIPDKIKIEILKGQ